MYILYMIIHIVTYIVIQLIVHHIVHTYTYRSISENLLIKFTSKYEYF